MYKNGLVIQRVTGITYKGIDGSGFSESTGLNWYFNFDDELAKDFEPFYDEYIGKTYYNLQPYSWVAVCNDISYIHRYIEESRKRNIKYRVLLCKSEISAPIITATDFKTSFLGYDYAYASGDYYSAVYNEVPFIFPQFQLNDNGLFQTEQEIRHYIKARETYTQSHEPYSLETGEFIIYKLYETDL